MRSEFVFNAPVYIYTDETIEGYFSEITYVGLKVPAMILVEYSHLNNYVFLTLEIVV